MGFLVKLNQFALSFVNAVRGFREDLWEPIKRDVQEFNTQMRERHQMPRIGEVIGITRGIYEHFGVYIGKNRVIHYTSYDDSLANNEVMETDMEHFLRGADSFFSIHFESINKKLQNKRRLSPAAFIASVLLRIRRTRPYYLFSGEETVIRARSQIGQRDYHLIHNNCEHFAFWCKTGERESHQFKTLFNRIYFTYPKMTNNSHLQDSRQSTTTPRAM